MDSFDLPRRPSVKVHNPRGILMRVCSLYFTPSSRLFHNAQRVRRDVVEFGCPAIAFDLFCSFEVAMSLTEDRSGFRCCFESWMSHRFN